MKPTSRLFAILPCAALVVVGCGSNSPEKRLQEARVAASQADSMSARGDLEQSLALARKALAIDADLSQDSCVAEGYLRLGLIEEMFGQYDTTLALLRYALEKAHGMSNPALERKGKIALAAFLVSMGSLDDAVSLASDAATSARFSSDGPGFYASAKILASAFDGLGKYDAEIQTLRELQRIDREKFDGRAAAALNADELNAFAVSGRRDSVRLVFQRWLRSSRLNGDSSSVAAANMEWGKFMQSAGNYDSSFRAYMRAVDALNARPDRFLQGRIFCLLGDLAYLQGNYENARRYYVESHDRVREHDRALGVMIAIQSAACLSHMDAPGDKKDLAAAAQLCQSLGDTCKNMGFHDGESFAAFVLGRISERLNEPAAALQLYGHAIDLDEQDMVADRHSDAMRVVQTFMTAEGTTLYDAAARLYVSVENVPEVFGMVERKNLRDIVQFFLRQNFRSSGGPPAEKIADVQWKRLELSNLHRHIVEELAENAPLGDQRLRMLQDVLPSRVADLADAETQLSNSYPAFSWLFCSRRVSLREIQEKVPDGSAVLEFMLAPNAVNTIVIRKDTAILRMFSVNEKYVLSLVGEYNQLIADERLTNESPAAGRSLMSARVARLSQVVASVLLDPIASYISNVSKLYVVMPPEFADLPVHTLRSAVLSSSTPLIQKYSISYLPSAAVLLFPPVLEKVVRDVVGIGCAGNTSWDVEYELQDIRAFYDKALLFFDTSATIDAVRGQRFDVLHMTAEFSLDSARPANSNFVLSDGASPTGLRPLALSGLVRLPATQDFVFSNISSRAGGFFRYPPLLLLANGTGTVVATMWAGDRKAKKYFGEVFYSNLQLGSSATSAYRQALVALSKKDEFSAAYRWGLYYQFGR